MVIIMAYFGIRSPVIMVIRSVIGISNRVIIPSVRTVINQAEANSRSYKIVVIWSVGIKLIVYINIACVMTVISSVVI